MASYRATDYALEALLERSLIERVDAHQFTVPDVFLRLWLLNT